MIVKMHNVWCPNWGYVREERITRPCQRCRGKDRMRAVLFDGRKYGERQRTMIDQFWYDDATLISTVPLCRSCFDAETTMRLMEAVTP